MADLSGKTILHYHILKQVGQGGMGVVYLAEDTKLDRKVAIKLLPGHIARNSDERKRFEIEAKAAAALNHPNIATIHAIEHSDDEMFIVMEYIEGQDLKQKLKSGLLDVDEAIRIANQIARGLEAAHEKNIIHRDIKSSNIMITDKGQVKIMDFGLAKVGEGIQLTREKSTIGTAPYMSPEQIRGDAVDPRSDIWSFGVVLYEMLSGELPFKGDYEQAVAYAIINENPGPLGQEVPKALQDIILQALVKDPERRFQSAEELVDSLERLSKSTRPEYRGIHEGYIDKLKHKPWIAAVIVAAVLLVFFFVIMPYYQLINLQKSQQLLPRINNLIKEQKYDEAFNLAKDAGKYLKDDPEFKKLYSGYADNLTIRTEPAGADVYIKRYAPGKNPGKEYIGKTPIENKTVIRGGYKIYIEKEGYALCERVYSSAYGLEGEKRQADVTINVNLLKQENYIENMVFVPGGRYELVGWDAPTSAEVRLNDFYMDKYEVSNKDFKKFIDAGGYQKKQYWTYPFIQNGKKLSWEEGVSQFKDQTGLPGPRHWKNEEYPEGKDNYPVTNVTWYEAAAFAEFVNKKLPTIFQWEKSARNGEYHIYDLVMPWGLKSPNDNILYRANFESNGTEEVNSFEFGISPFGCYNMAGNVREWCLNETNKGFVTTGGSWQDPVYMYANYGTFPSFYSSPQLGFRCVKTTSPGAGEDAMKINLEEKIPVYLPVDEKTFQTFRAYYRYDKKPLDPQIIDSIETADWWKEKITFSGNNNDRIIAYLYLPKKAAKPFQCINWIPHAGVISGTQETDEAAEYSLAAHIKAGRALLAMIPKGARERPREPGFEYPDYSTVKYCDMVIDYVTEFSMGVDYLATRDDIDMNKLAYLGTSWGATRTGVIIAALDKRYRSVIFISGGVRKSALKALPEVNMVNFAPYIRAPKLLLNGKYDEAFALETEAIPLYALFSEPKKLVLVNSGHVPPVEERIPIINKWLDDTLGPVRFEE
jgi:serine/threonine protein kinase/formylglycine-generating enzyme required for sulfatase activity